MKTKSKETRMALSGAHVPPTKVFRRLTGSVNKTTVSMRKISWKFVHNFFRYPAEIKKIRCESGSRIRTLIRIRLKT